MNRDIVTEKIRDYILKSTNEKNVDETMNLFDLGIIHSLFAVQLIIFIERTFQIELDDDDLDMDHIKSIKDIADLVLKHG